MLKVIRQNLGLKQTHVSALLGYNVSTMLSLWESEIALPDATNLMKLCIIYGKTAEELYPEYYNHIRQQLEDRGLL